MQSETGFPISHQLKSYVASKSRLKLAARAVLSADAGLLVLAYIREIAYCRFMQHRPMVRFLCDDPNSAFIIIYGYLKIVSL